MATVGVKGLKVRTWRVTSLRSRSTTWQISMTRSLFRLISTWSCISSTSPVTHSELLRTNVSSRESMRSRWRSCDVANIVIRNSFSATSCPTPTDRPHSFSRDPQLYVSAGSEWDCTGDVKRGQIFEAEDNFPRCRFTIYHLLRLDRPDGFLPISTCTSVARSDSSFR